MAANKETKLSLKDKLYEETLDEFARKQWNPESLKNDFKNWKEMTKVYPKKDRGWLIYQADIEKAVMLAIEKTYSALQSGGLTEAGQSLYDRRKDIEAHTANQIFDGLAECQIDTSRLSPEEALRAIIQREDILWYWVLDGDKVDAVKKEFGVD